MLKSRQVLLFAVIAIIAVAAGLLLRAQLTQGIVEHKGVDPTNSGAEAIFSSSLPDLQGVPQPLSQWRGHVMVVNFWATWCEPCRTEIPEFMELQERFRDQNLIFVGIAVDQREKVMAFTTEMGINYPVLIGGIETMTLAGKAGNPQGALPFTVIIDGAGKIVQTHLGRLRQSKLEAALKPLL